MKKISYFIISLIFLMNTIACTGYKPIFSSSNLKIKIVDYSIIGDKRLGNQIYYKLDKFTQLDADGPEVKNISMLINSSKNKTATVKDTAGKILSYKINLLTLITVKDFTTDKVIINESFSYSSSYKVQDQYSETLNLENRVTENLINKTYDDLLIKMTEIYMEK